MGIEFIRATTASHRKAWFSAKQAGTTDILAVAPPTLDRCFMASIESGRSLAPDQQVLIRSIRDEVAIYGGLMRLATVTRPKQWLRDRLCDGFGVLGGHVEELHTKAGKVSVRIGEST